MKTLTITAKFASTCPCCKTPIEVGTKVLWSKGYKARHVGCKTEGELFTRLWVDVLLGKVEGVRAHG